MLSIRCFAVTGGDNASYALGEIAFEQGQFAAARAQWERLSQLLRGPAGRPLWLALRNIDLEKDWARAAPLLLTRTTKPDWLAYPDTEIPLAEIRARLILVSIMERSFERAGIELKAFEKMHLKAEGKLAGRKVVLATRLRKLLQEAKTWPSPPLERSWTTFAGSSHRTRLTKKGVTIAGLAWGNPIELPTTKDKNNRTLRGLGFSNRRIAEHSDRPLSFHPIVTNDTLLVNDSESIYAYKLSTGLPAFDKSGKLYSANAGIEKSNLRQRAKIGLPRYTMTVAGNIVYARMGGPVTSRFDENRRGRSQQLVGLDLSRGGMLVFMAKLEESEWAFEGSPLGDEDNVYIAMRKSDITPRAYIACYSASSGKMKWRTFIATAATPALPGWEEITHNLLTLVDGTLYYNTNLGVVASVDARSGNINWVSRYDRANKGDITKRAGHFYRDLTPCVYSDGMLYVAPSDSPLVFSLDAQTGQTLWVNDLTTNAVHLLGVADGSLIASGDRLWWLDVQTGKTIARWPVNIKNGPKGQGRGAIAGDTIYWPTRGNKLLLFPTKPEQPAIDRCHPTESIDLADFNATSGNVVSANGFLIIASHDKLYAFDQFSRKQKELKGQAEANPNDAAAQFRFAECEKAMKHWHIAQRFYLRAMQLSKKEKRQSGIFQRASNQLTNMLLAQAQTLLHDDNYTEARKLLTSATRQAGLANNRVRSILALAKLESKQEHPVRAITLWQALLEEETFSNCMVAVEANRKLAAGQLAQQEIDRTIQQFGRGVYARFEAKATADFQRLAKHGTALEYQRIAWKYPNALVTKQWLLDFKRKAKPQQPQKTQSATSRNVHPNAFGPKLQIHSLTTPTDWHLPLLQSNSEISISNKIVIGLPEDKKRLQGYAMSKNVKSNVPPSTTLQFQKGNWSIELQEEIIDVVQTDKKAIIATQHILQSVRRLDGKVLWKHSKPKTKLKQIQQTGKFLDVLWNNGSLTRYIASSGKQVWSYRMPKWEPANPPVQIGKFILLQLLQTTKSSQQGDLVQTVLLNATSGNLVRIISEQSDNTRGSFQNHVVAIQRKKDNHPIDIKHVNGFATNSKWVRRPLAIDNHRVLVVDAAGTVRMIDCERGAQVWSRSVPQLPASHPEILFVKKANALLLFTGLGDMIRINLNNGCDLWPQPVPVGPQILARPRYVSAVDADAVYFVSAGKLKAFLLKNGKEKWPECDVRDALDERRWQWQTKRFGEYVVAYPLEFTEFDGLRFVVIKAKTGKRVFQSADLHAPPGPATVVWKNSYAVVAGHGRMWKLTWGD